MITFRSKNKKYTVTINDTALTKMLSAMLEGKKNETGGVLLGDYSKDLMVAHIRAATGPPPGSKKGTTWFERGFKGLTQMFQKLWSEKLFYLGEWHTHPAADPDPSGTDIAQMISISKKNNLACPEPILIIIGGSVKEYQLRIFVFLGTSMNELKREI